MLTWTSTNTSIAAVSASGLVTANAAGSARIVASIDGKADTVNIAVVAVPVGSVSVQPGSVTLGGGADDHSHRNVKDANGAVVTDRPVTWTPAIHWSRAVTQTGVVKGIAGG